jgi:three-Cys-motif partner protein
MSTEQNSTTVRLFEPDAEGDDLLRGSVRVALETDPPFDRYLFIEKNAKWAGELERLKEDFPARAPAIQIECGNANEVLQRWCASSDWSRQRAVVFLDPFGMQTSWSTVETLARTEGVDLWYLFPLGQGLNRLLPRDRPPDDVNAACVTRVLGTDTWHKAFYRSQFRSGLFEDLERWEKQVGFEELKAFLVNRLRSVFAEVAPRPRELRNSKNTPLFLLCFAASNPKGARTAVKIASHLLTR